VYKEGRIIERFKIYRKAAEKCKGKPFDEFWECIDREFKKAEVIEVKPN